MLQAILIFIGGGTGALCRFGTSVLMGRWLGTGFPYGTLLVNLLGAALIGLFIELSALKFNAPDHLRLLLVTGFLGGYTTFSAFSLETALMLQRGDYVTALLYAAASLFGTIGLVVATTWLVRQFI